MKPDRLPDLDERRLNLLKDGSRRVLYGGDAYEDDLEPDSGRGTSREGPEVALPRRAGLA
jgi:hypothetical protein